MVKLLSSSSSHLENPSSKWISLSGMFQEIQQLTEQGTFPAFPVPQYSPVPPVCSFHRSLVSRDKVALPLPSGRNSATGRYLEAQQKKRRDGAWNLFGLERNSKDREFREKFLTIPNASSISSNNRNPALPPPQNVTDPSFQMGFYYRSENSRQGLRKKNYLKGISRG